MEPEHRQGPDRLIFHRKGWTTDTESERFVSVRLTGAVTSVEPTRGTVNATNKSSAEYVAVTDTEDDDSEAGTCTGTPGLCAAGRTHPPATERTAVPARSIATACAE
jgi:hypothetical protein